jgi:hypothetical protein
MTGTNKFGTERDHICIAASAVNNITSAVSPSVSVEQRLVRHLLRHYDTDARGVSNVSRTVRVEIELMLQRIQHLVRIPQCWLVGSLNILQVVMTISIFFLFIFPFLPTVTFKTAIWSNEPLPFAMSQDFCWHAYTSTPYYFIARL